MKPTSENYTQMMAPIGPNHTVVDKEYLSLLERIAALSARDHGLPSPWPGIKQYYGSKLSDVERMELKECLFSILRF